MVFKPNRKTSCSQTKPAHLKKFIYPFSLTAFDKRYKKKYMKLWFWLRLDYPEMLFGDFFGDYNSMRSVLLLSLFFGSNFLPQSQNFKLSVFAGAHKINCLQILFAQIHLEGFQSNAQPNVKRLLPWLALGSATFFCVVASNWSQERMSSLVDAHMYGKEEQTILCFFNSQRLYSAEQRKTDIGLKLPCVTYN